MAKNGHSKKNQKGKNKSSNKSKERDQKKSSTPYDELYKQVFSHKEVMTNLFDFVPYPLVDFLNFYHMRMINSEFIDSKLRKSLSDLVWRIEYKGRESALFVVAEYQSYKDVRIAIRVHQYTSSVQKEIGTKYVDYIKQYGDPFVWAIVIYNGQTDWDSLDSITELLDKNSEADICDQFGVNLRKFEDMFFLNLKNIPPDQLEKHRGFFSLYVGLMTAKNYDEFRRVWYSYKNELTDPNNIYLYETFKICAKLVLIECLPGSKDEINKLNTFDEIGDSMFRLSAMAQEMDYLKAQVKEMNTLKAKVKEMDTLRAQVKEMDDLKAQVKEMNTLKAKVKEMDTLRAQVKEMDTLKAQVKEMDTLKAQVKEKDSLIDRMKAKVQSNEAQLAEYAKVIESLKAQVRKGVIVPS